MMFRTLYRFLCQLLELGHDRALDGRCKSKRFVTLTQWVFGFLTPSRETWKGGGGPGRLKKTVTAQTKIWKAGQGTQPQRPGKKKK